MAVDEWLLVVMVIIAIGSFDRLSCDVNLEDKSAASNSEDIDIDDDDEDDMDAPEGAVNRLE